MPSKYTPKRVPISGERLKAALKSAQLSTREAERCLPAGTRGGSNQNLDNIVNGKQHRCHPTLRDGLAKLLRLPNAEWLGSEQDLPDLPWWESPRTIGREGGPSGLDLNQRALPGTRWHKTMDKAREFFGLPPTERGGMPPQYQLLAWRLARDIEQAWSRSFGGLEGGTEYPETVSDSDEALARRVRSGFGLDEDIAEDHALAQRVRSGYVPLYALPAVAALLSLSFWRRLVMDELYGGPINPEEMERFAAGMEQAARTLLGPWLDDEMEVKPLEQLEAMFAGLARLGKTLAHTELRTDFVEVARQRVKRPIGSKPAKSMSLAELRKVLREDPSSLDRLVDAEFERQEDQGPRKGGLRLLLKAAKPLEAAKPPEERCLTNELTTALRNLDDAATETPPWRRPPEKTPTAQEAPT